MSFKASAEAQAEGKSIGTELVNALVAEDLRLFVDLSELDDAKPAGELPVRAVLPNGVALVRTEPATVEIRPKE